MKKAAFIGDAAHINNVFSTQTKTALFGELTFIADGETITREMLPQYKDMLAEVEYLFSTWGMLNLSEEEIHTYLPSVKALFYAAGSVQYFAKPFINCGITVCSAWHANGIPVAEYTLAQITLATKGFFQRLHKPGSGPAWKNKPTAVDLMPGNYDITVGIIGAGMIGRMVIEKLHTCLDHVRVLVFDPFLSEEKAQEMQVTKVELPVLFAESDVVSNHLANNPQTVGMLNAPLFNAMKPHAVFINTGRGAQVVEDDMIAALQAVPSRAAVLDVTYPEPPAEDSLLYTMDNVYLTPHIAGSLGNEVHRMAEFMYEEYRRFAEDKSCLYSVSAKMLETMA